MVPRSLVRLIVACFLVSGLFLIACVISRPISIFRVFSEENNIVTREIELQINR